MRLLSFKREASKSEWKFTRFKSWSKGTNPIKHDGFSSGFQESQI